MASRPEGSEGVLLGCLKARLDIASLQNAAGATVANALHRLLFLQQTGTAGQKWRDAAIPTSLPSSVSIHSPEGNRLATTALPCRSPQHQMIYQGKRGGHTSSLFVWLAPYASCDVPSITELPGHLTLLHPEAGNAYVIGAYSVRIEGSLDRTIS